MDFEKKRMQFWLETVPDDIRRIEYELFTRYRKLFNQNINKHARQERHGRYSLVRAMSPEEEREMWQSYRNSFLQGDERKNRFEEILSNVHLAIPQLTTQLENISQDKILLIALSGSSCYGPRRKAEFLSDIDIAYLIDESISVCNFEKLPNMADPPEKQFHLVATGITDAARGENRDMHWLLFPHFPIINTLPDSNLRQIINRIVKDTRKRKPELEEKIKKLDIYLANGRCDQINS